jgi:hypothetical protein
MGQYSMHAGEPAQPVQQSVVMASMRGFFLRVALPSPTDIGQCFSTIPIIRCSVFRGLEDWKQFNTSGAAAQWNSTRARRIVFRRRKTFAIGDLKRLKSQTSSSTRPREART